MRLKHSITCAIKFNYKIDNRDLSINIYIEEHFDFNISIHKKGNKETNK